MSNTKRIIAVALSIVLIMSVMGAGVAMAGEEAETDDEGDGLEEEESTDNETDDGNESDDDLNETEDGDDLNESDDDANETDDDAFGQLVTQFVHDVMAGSNNDTNTTNDTNVPLGLQIAAFVTSKNPGNANVTLGDVGPPEHAGSGNETGQPEHAGPGNETGQPDDVGPDGENGPDDEDDENRGGGPPEERGGPK